MNDKRLFRDKLARGGRETTEEELALEVAEDKRLARLGIDPNQSPDAILDALKKKEAELRAAIAANPADDASEEKPE